jgi:hypothetical protein
MRANRVAEIKEALRTKILDVLRRQHLMTIATVRSDGLVLLVLSADNQETSSIGYDDDDG